MTGAEDVERDHQTVRCHYCGEEFSANEDHHCDFEKETPGKEHRRSFGVFPETLLFCFGVGMGVGVALAPFLGRTNTVVVALMFTVISAVIIHREWRGEHYAV